MTELPEILLNGQRHCLGAGDPSESLLRWLKRQQLHGTKEGCADGDCGACTVALRLPDVDGKPQWQAVNACLLPVGCLPGREVMTVEALAVGERLHPVQQAMVECAGSQCGYCTPGFVMSLFAAQAADQLDEACFEGNLCRCTGYLPIRRALERLQDLPFQAPALGTDAPCLESGNAEGWSVPRDLAHALAIKQADPQAVWFAGGTDLGVVLSHGQSKPARYIALDRLPELQQIEIGDQVVRIGAGVALRTIEQRLTGMFAAIDQMLPWFAARQVRNRATLGGNLGTASPIGDLLPVLLVLDAVVHVRSAAGSRDLAIDEFFTGYRQTQLRPDELIEAVSIPRRNDWLSAAYKVAKRQTDDISIVAAVFALKLNAERRVEAARLAFGGVAALPLRAKRAEAELIGQRLDQTTIEAIADTLRAEFTPLSDLRAGADYRRALCGNLFAKFIREQFEPAEVAA
ncbi:FAD binding domain-containing protein [Pseudoxanthomonas sp. CAU 1598]|uniref:FAD binding domain-containing protein n=2 Tax=Pseudomarimonas arenosa TaxID=2774145 RepID=A0AAW3ZJC4_9GAMM|nr:FAD binding domain-containing protein [Pseudomarimonas arenosa]